jgi:hypothetical protein
MVNAHGSFGNISYDSAMIDDDKLSEDIDHKRHEYNGGFKDAGRFAEDKSFTEHISRISDNKNDGDDLPEIVTHNHPDHWKNSKMNIIYQDWAANISAAFTDEEFPEHDIREDKNNHVKVISIDDPALDEQFDGNEIATNDVYQKTRKHPTELAWKHPEYNMKRNPKAKNAKQRRTYRQYKKINDSDEKDTTHDIIEELMSEI